MRLEYEKAYIDLRMLLTSIERNYFTDLLKKKGDKLTLRFKGDIDFSLNIDLCRSRGECRAIVKEIKAKEVINEETISQIENVKKIKSMLEKFYGNGKGIILN